MRFGFFVSVSIATLIASAHVAGPALAQTASEQAPEPQPPAPQLLAIGETVTGMITHAPQEPENVEGPPGAVWRVPARAGTVLTVTMQSAQFASSVWVGSTANIGECPDCIGAVSDENGRVLLRYLPTTDGNLFIRASSIDTRLGSYTLRADATPLGPLRPTRLTLGRPVTGTWTQQDTVNHIGQTIDAFNIRLTAGQLVQINLEATNVPENGVNPDPILRLFGPHPRGARPTVEPLVIDDDGGQGLDARIRFMPERSGDYLLFAGPLSGQPIGSYRLSANIPPPMPPLPEPIAIGGGMRINGQLSANSPVLDFVGEEMRGELFRFLAVAGRRYEIIAESDQFDTIINLGTIGPANSFSSVMAIDDGMGDTTNARLQFRQNETLPYTILVGGIGEAPSGRFTLTLREVPTLPAPTTAIPIGATDTVTGTLIAEGPLRENNASYHAYALPLNAGQSVRIRMAPVNPEINMDPYLEIGTGTPAAFEVVSVDDDSGPGYHARLDFTASQAGTYIVRASTLGQDQLGQYTLSLGPVLPPPPPPVPTPITIGQEVRGALNEADKNETFDPDIGMIEDYYVFDAEAGQTFIIAGRSSDFDAIISARSGNAQAVGMPGDMDQYYWAIDDDSGGELNPLLEFEATESGPQIIKLGGLNMGMGNYTLVVTPKP